MQEASLTFHKKQKSCLELALQNEDEVVCGIENTGQGYRYCCFATQESFAAFLLSDHPESKYANEMLTRATVSYFDIDAKCSLKQLQWETKKALLDSVTKFIKECFKKYLNIALKKKDFKWSDSTRPEKVSFHLVIQHSDFYWKVEHRTELKHFVQQIRKDSLKHFGMYTYKEQNGSLIKESIFDPKVYSKNRLFRCLGCAKRENDICLKPVNKKKTYIESTLGPPRYCNRHRGTTSVTLQKTRNCTEN